METVEKSEGSTERGDRELLRAVSDVSPPLKTHRLNPGEGPLRRP